jgi:hypothetical protein
VTPTEAGRVERLAKGFVWALRRDDAYTAKLAYERYDDLAWRVGLPARLLFHEVIERLYATGWTGPAHAPPSRAKRLR